MKNILNHKSVSLTLAPVLVTSALFSNSVQANDLNTTAAWPSTANVAYIDTTAAGSFSNIIDQNIKDYNVMVFGFANSDGSLSSQTLSSIKSIKSMEAPGTLNIISFGGETAQNLNLDASTIANLQKTLIENDIDGIDLDIEQSSISASTIASFAHNLRNAIGTNKALVAAPILAGTPESPSLNIPNGGQDITSAFSGNDFDAILVQAYNSGTNFTYKDPISGQFVNEGSPNIIQASYDSLQKSSKINPSTKIVIGIPANPGGAPTASNIWAQPNNANDVVNSIKSNLNNIKNNQSSINNSQFGGLMVWSLNTDFMPDAYPSSYGVNQSAGFYTNNVAKLL
jgi:chitinase